MASMRPMVANLLLRLAGWSPDAAVSGWQLIDPFCGSATILIEAVLAAQAGPSPLAPGTAVHGIERFAGHIAGAGRNIANAGLKDRIVIHAGLAEHTGRMLPKRSPGDPRRRLVVTNPPFGRRVGNPRQVDAIYRRAARAWAACGVRRLVTLAERRRSMAEALVDAGYHLERHTDAVYGATPVGVFVAVRDAS